jgi:hypothetical protein
MFNSLRHVARPLAGARRRFAQMPVPQSQNAPLWLGHDQGVTSEGWETWTYLYFGIAVVLQVAIVGFAPETSIESWARPEAQARLKLAERGFTDFKFGTHYQELLKDENTEIWQKYSERAVLPGDDDDDDDDDDEVRLFRVAYCACWRFICFRNRISPSIILFLFLLNVG